jgi:ABC-type nitrate/sulfonate/bicarbonate transport system substrate-binding protein
MLGFRSMESPMRGSITRRGVIGTAAFAVAHQASAQPTGEIPIGVASTSLVACSARIANEMGLFQRRGLRPRFVMMDSANTATAALISGSVRLAVSGPGELVVAQSRGQKVVVIASTYGGLGASLVLGKAVADKLGLSASAPVNERLKALDGLLIASTTATSSYTVAIRSAANAAGAKLRLTYMAQAAMPAALESGVVQGFFTSAPFWAFPVLRGVGVVWISGPKGELPREHAPASSASLQVMRDFAEANPELMRSAASVIADLVRAIDERPGEVKAAVAKLYPDLDAPTLDLLFASESVAWKARPLTPEDMAHEVAFVKANGTALPQIDRVDPGSMLFP